jgi:hypothetical protein
MALYLLNTNTVLYAYKSILGAVHRTTQLDDKLKRSLYWYYYDTYYIYECTSFSFIFFIIRYSIFLSVWKWKCLP